MFNGFQMITYGTPCQVVEYHGPGSGGREIMLQYAKADNRWILRTPEATGIISPNNAASIIRKVSEWLDSLNLEVEPRADLYDKGERC